jgi:hypothetical protein
METGKPSLERFDFSAFKAFVNAKFANEPEKQEELF